MPWVKDMTKKDSVPYFVPDAAVLGIQPSPTPPLPGVPANSANAPPPGRTPAAVANVVATAVPGQITIPTPLTNGPQRITCVPYQWSRVKCPQRNSAYYISPSGHVLLDRPAVLKYLEQKFTCKCFLNLSNKFEDVFDFNIEVNHLNAKDITGIAPNNRCVEWLGAYERQEDYLHLQAKMLRALHYLSSLEVNDLKEIYRILHKLDSKSTVDQNSFFRWLATFPWNAIRVSKDGRMFAYELSQEQLKHLTYELWQNGELKEKNEPEVATTSSKASVPICDTTNSLPVVPPATISTLPPPQTHLSTNTRHMASFARTPFSSSSSTALPFASLPGQPRPERPLRVYHPKGRIRPSTQPQPQQTIQPPTPPIAVGQLQPCTFQLTSNNQAPIKIGSTVTSSIPASLAVGFKSVSVVKAGLAATTAGRRKAGGKNAVNTKQPVMIVSNAPTNNNPSSLVAAVAQQFQKHQQQQQQQQGHFFTPSTSGGPHQLLEIPKGCKPELIVVKDGQVSTHHLVMNGHSKHLEFAPPNLLRSMPGCSATSTPTTTKRTQIDTEKTRALFAQLVNSKPEAKAEEAKKVATAVQPLQTPLPPPPLPSPPVTTPLKEKMTPSTSGRPRATPITKRTRLSKAAKEAKEQFEQEAAKELKKRNELAANRELNADYLQAVASVLNTPIRNKQEDSGHLRRPISPQLTLPCFETAFKQKANRLITAEPLKPLPTIDTLMAPNRPLKYIQILNPPAVGALVSAAAAAVASTASATSTTTTTSSTFLLGSGGSVLVSWATTAKTTSSTSNSSSGSSQLSASVATSDAAVARPPPSETTTVIEPLKTSQAKTSNVFRIKVIDNSSSSGGITQLPSQQQHVLPLQQPPPFTVSVTNTAVPQLQQQLPQQPLSSHTFEPYEMVIDPPVNRLDYANSLLDLRKTPVITSSTNFPPSSNTVLPTTSTESAIDFEGNNVQPVNAHSLMHSSSSLESIPKCVDLSLSAFDDKHETAALDLQTRPTKATTEEEECKSMRSEMKTDAHASETRPIFESDNLELIRKKPEKVQIENKPNLSLSSSSQQQQSSSETMDRKKSMPEEVEENNVEKKAVLTNQSIVDDPELPIEESVESLEKNYRESRYQKEENSSKNFNEEAALSITKENHEPVKGDDSTMQVEYEESANGNVEVKKEEKHESNDLTDKEGVHFLGDMLEGSSSEPELPMDGVYEDDNDDEEEEQVDLSELARRIQQVEEEEEEEEAMNTYVSSISSLNEAAATPNSELLEDEESDDSDDSDEEEELMNSSREQRTPDKKESDGDEIMEDDDEEEEDEDEEIEVDEKGPSFSKRSPNSPPIIASGSSDKTTNSLHSDQSSQQPQLPFLTISELPASSSLPLSAAAPNLSPPTSFPSSPAEQSSALGACPPSPEQVAVEEGNTTATAILPSIEQQNEDDMAEEENQSMMEDDQSTITSTSAVSSPFDGQPPPDSPQDLTTTEATVVTITTDNNTVITTTTTNINTGEHFRNLRTSSPDSPASKGSRTSSRTSRSSRASRSSMTASPSATAVVRTTVRPSRTTRSSRSSFLVTSRSVRSSRSSSSSQSSSRSSSPKIPTAATVATSSSSNAQNDIERICSSLSSSPSSSSKANNSSNRHRHNSSGGGNTTSNTTTADDGDITGGDGDDEQKRQQRRMERLKKELEFQGRPMKANSEGSEEKDRMSPPLPPQERVFKIGDIVFGQRGDVRYWPGKVISYGRSTRVDRPVPLDAKVTVLWYGKGVSAEKETLMTVSTLLTLSEGLEEHHRLKKRTRSGSYKRMNHDLEDAIQEAVGWDEPEVLTSSSET